MWTLTVLAIVGIASVPAYRTPWSAVLTLDATSGVLQSEALTNFTTPYVSFVSLQPKPDFPFDPRAVHISVVSGSDRIGSADDARQRILLNVDETSILTSIGDTLTWTLRRPVQLETSDACRVVLDGGTSEHSVQSIQSARVTIGYDGRYPVVTVLRYWWPWIAGSWLLATTQLLRRRWWPAQSRLIGASRRVVREHQPVLWLLFAAGLVRLVMALGGGQYFDGDELRYGGSSTTMFGLLATGHLNHALDALLHSPDHPGFRLTALFPAFVHVLSAFPTGHAISDMRFHSGEWLPAFILSLASVSSIGLTYMLALRTGASRVEAFAAALLMFCSCSLLVYARHLFPYDVAMALALFALWIGLNRKGAPTRSYLTGLICGLAFLTYEGYWTTVVAVGLLHILRAPSFADWIRRGLVFSVGVVTFPATLEILGRSRGIAFLQDMAAFSRTVSHGEFSEGWRLPWAYLWNSEHGLFVVYLLGGLVALCSSRPRGAVTTRRAAAPWLLAVAGIYASLALGSTVLHRFVVYDRLARQLLPFLCLAAASGLIVLLAEKQARSARAGCAVLMLLFTFNAVPLFQQRFPREIAADIASRYGVENVRLASTLPESVDDLTPIFLPFDSSSANARYVLVNAKDIWIPVGASQLARLPEGEILLKERHPRQLRSMQYHGYTPQQRTFLRALDISIRLIDTGAARP